MQQRVTEPLFEDDKVSQVKFKRTGMKVVRSSYRESYDIFNPPNRGVDLESQYDPQAEYMEKASRYHVDRSFKYDRQ